LDKKLEKKLANLLIESEPDDFFEYERMALGDELNSEQEELLKKDPIKF